MEAPSLTPLPRVQCNHVHSGLYEGSPKERVSLLRANMHCGNPHTVLYFRLLHTLQALTAAERH